MSRGDNLRIYYGDARIMLPADDPRVAQILALVIRDLPAASEARCAVPRNDAEFLAVAAAFFKRRTTG